MTGIARNLDSGERLSIACRYLVGCDGGRSVVRHAIGAEMAGIPVVQRVQSTYFRAPALMSLLPGPSRAGCISRSIRAVAAP